MYLGLEYEVAPRRGNTEEILDGWDIIEDVGLEWGTSNKDFKSSNLPNNFFLLSSFQYQSI